jgi:hypothetical protein
MKDLEVSALPRRARARGARLFAPVSAPNPGGRAPIHVSIPCSDGITYPRAQTVKFLDGDL